MYLAIRLLLIIRSFMFHFFLSNVQTLKLSSLFSQELWDLYSWNLVHTWTMGGCIVYSEITLLSLFALCSETVWPTKLKLSQTWTMGGCIVYTEITLLSLFVSVYFLCSVRNCEARPMQLKLDTHVDNGWMYCLYRNHAAQFICLCIFSLFCLSNYQLLTCFSPQIGL